MFVVIILESIIQLCLQNFSTLLKLVLTALKKFSRSRSFFYISHEKCLTYFLKAHNWVINILKSSTWKFQFHSRDLRGFPFKSSSKKLCKEKFDENLLLILEAFHSLMESKYNNSMLMHILHTNNSKIQQLFINNVMDVNAST